MAVHNITGRIGEQLGAAYLLKNDYLLLHKNWRYLHLEIDIIASKKDVLHFIEIKTRKSKIFGNPEDSVTKKKIKNLIKASEEYLFLNPQWQRIQFDILAISITKFKSPEYFLIEDVYL